MRKPSVGVDHIRDKPPCTTIQDSERLETFVIGGEEIVLYKGVDQSRNNSPAFLRLVIGYAKLSFPKTPEDEDDYNDDVDDAQSAQCKTNSM